jgi:hypothetical protein
MVTREKLPDRLALCRPCSVRNLQDFTIFTFDNVVERTQLSYFVEVGPEASAEITIQLFLVPAADNDGECISDRRERRVCVVTDNAPNPYGLGPRTQDAELAPSVEHCVVICNQDRRSVQEFRRKVAWSSLVLNAAYRHFFGFLDGLPEELVVSAQIHQWKMHLVDESLGNQEPN